MYRRFDINEALKALAHPGRFEFLIWLKELEGDSRAKAGAEFDGVNAGYFERSGLSQSAVSSHLGILHRAGLVTTRRVGSKVLYRREEQNIARLKAWLEDSL